MNSFERKVKFVFPVIVLAIISILVLFPAIASAAENYQYGGKWGTFGTGAGQFDNAYDIDISPSGHFFVADLDNQRIQEFDANRTFVRQWGSLGTGDGQFQNPVGLAVNASGQIYVADLLNHRIQIFGPTGNHLSTWGGFGAGNGNFVYPQGIAIDGHGNVYVADTMNHRIQKFDAGGNFLTKWGWFGTGAGQFNMPKAIVIDSSDNVYVADAGNARVQKFTDTGGFVAEWGSLGAADGQFYDPEGIGVDIFGNVYVSDSGNNRIQKFDAGGTLITKWGSIGPANGQLQQPRGIAVDSAASVYVVEDFNNRVQKFEVSYSSPVAPGTNVNVTLDNGTTFKFDNVASGGTLSVTVSKGNDTQDDFKIKKSLYYDISFSGSFTGNVEVTFPYDDAGMTLTQEQNLKLKHANPSPPPAWTDITQSVDTGANTITGITTSFSPFVIAEPLAPVPASSGAGILILALLGSLTLWGCKHGGRADDNSGKSLLRVKSKQFH